jgi:hypothetical protein
MSSAATTSPPLLRPEIPSLLGRPIRLFDRIEGPEDGILLELARIVTLGCKSGRIGRALFSFWVEDSGNVYPGGGIVMGRSR